jgi:hypothetical protein
MAIVKVNQNAYESGEEYIGRLNQEAEVNFKALLTMLSSYWQSTVDGPNYAREIKAVAIAMSRIRIALDDVKSDGDYRSTRAEFLYQVLGSMLFPGEMANPSHNDADFAAFLRNLVKTYFAGSVPASIKAAVELVVDGMQVRVTENYVEARKPGSGLDISDEHTFCVDVMLSSPGSIDAFLAEKNTRILLDILRPAHTLYKLKFVLRDEYLGNRTKEGDLVIEPSKVSDSSRFDLSSYGYEDFRKFVEGIEGLDPLGAKKSVFVENEDHSLDF